MNQPPFDPSQPQYGQPQPGQPQYGPPPGYGYPPPKQKSFLARHKILTVLGALVVLIVIIAVVSSGGSSGGGGSEGSTAAAGSSSAAKPGIGAPVRDGKFEFTVTAVDPPTSSVGEGPLEKTAQGQFVVVRLTVRNTGDREQYFDQSSQKLIDGQGRQLAPDTIAGAYVDPDNVFTQINPGNQVSGVLVFDVPAGAVPTTLELHDSAFSGGVEVALT